MISQKIESYRKWLRTEKGMNSKGHYVQAATWTILFPVKG